MKIFGIDITDEHFNLYFEEKEILYKDYKSRKEIFFDFRYGQFTKKADSYNAEKKTIVVYAPKQNVVELANNILNAEKENIRAKWLDNKSEKEIYENETDTKMYLDLVDMLFFNISAFMFCLTADIQSISERFSDSAVKIIKEFRNCCNETTETEVIEDTENVKDTDDCHKVLINNSADEISFKELLEKSNMKMTQFSEYFNVPYRTVQDWKAGVRKCPAYVVELLIYKLEKEKIIK